MALTKGSPEPTEPDWSKKRKREKRRRETVQDKKIEEDKSSTCTKKQEVQIETKRDHVIS